MFVVSDNKSRQCIFGVKKHVINENKCVVGYSGNLTALLYIFTLLGLRHNYGYSVYSRYRHKTYLYSDTHGNNFIKGNSNNLQVRNYKAILGGIVSDEKMLKKMIKVDEALRVSAFISKGTRSKRHVIKLSNFAYFLKTTFNMSGIPLSFGLAYSPACIEQLRTISKKINYNYTIESLDQYLDLMKKMIIEDGDEYSEYINIMYRGLSRFAKSIDKHKYHQFNKIKPKWYRSVLINTFLDFQIEDINL